MSSSSPAPAANEITFVLSDLPDLDTLLAGLPAGSEVHVLDARSDALAEMAAIVADRSNIDAIHLFSHGSAGRINLGATALTSDTLDARSAELATIRATAANPAPEPHNLPAAGFQYPR